MLILLGEGLLNSILDGLWQGLSGLVLLYPHWLGQSVLDCAPARSDWVCKLPLLLFLDLNSAHLCVDTLLARLLLRSGGNILEDWPENGRLLALELGMYLEGG